MLVSNLKPWEQEVHVPLTEPAKRPSVPTLYQIIWGSKKTTLAESQASHKNRILVVSLLLWKIFLG